MRIGLDFDGTIVDTTTAKVRFAREAFGEELSALETWGQVGRERIGEARFMEMVRASHEELTLTAPPMPGARDAIARLARDHELFVVTARSDDELPWAEQWVAAHAPAISSVVHTNRGPKLDACRALEIELMLDDIPSVLHDLAEAGLGAALIEAEYNRDQPRHERVHAVPHWRDFVALCARQAAASTRPRSR
jgi:uncharacterized HAD superfamily protein